MKEQIEYERRLREVADKSNAKKQARNHKIKDDELRKLTEERNMRMMKNKSSLEDVHAQRLVNWVISRGHSKQEAYEALAHVMGADL